MKIAINAQRVNLHNVTINLIKALGNLDDGPEEYVIIAPWSEPEKIKAYLGPNQRLVRGPQPKEMRPFAKLPVWSRPLAQKIHRWAYDIINPPVPIFEIPVSNGFYEGLGCDVIHFPDQAYTVCALPTVYNPHDIQHVHYPQFFSPHEIVWREGTFSTACRNARVVVAGSQWVKEDIMEHYGISPRKVQVIPWAAPNESIPSPSIDFIKDVNKKYHLPDIFAFYPAMLWKHKNHIALIEALAYLRDEKGLKVNLVCTGSIQSDNGPKIVEKIEELGLETQVQVIGVVSRQELRSIYQLAQFVIIPTLFEAASAPVFEAWFEGVPVACSTVTSLPEQAGDAALLFDPFSIYEIASAIESLALNELLRQNLIAKGQKRLQDFDWGRTARAYRAVYRSVARKSLDDEDRRLLSWDWMKNPSLLSGESS